FAAVSPASVKKFASDQLKKNARVVVYAVPGDKKLPPDPAAPPKPEKATTQVESKEPWRNTAPSPGPEVKAQLPSPKRMALSDVVENPAFAEKELERVRNDRLTALMQQRDQPWPTALRVMNACLFGPTHPYGHTALGTEESLKKMSRADLATLYKSTFSPKN